MARRILFYVDDEEDAIIEAIAVMQRRPRMIKPRIDYLGMYDGDDFKVRFRISKSTFRAVLREIGREISPPSQRNNAIPAATKLYMELRYLATDSFLISVADFTGLSKTSACCYVHQMYKAIAGRRPVVISFPHYADQSRRICTGFYERSRFPRVIGAVDCTHVKIQSPGGENAETFRNRKGYFSINVQCICDPWLKIMDIVARWPGPCHDQTIFDNSNVKFLFEAQIIQGYYLLGDSGYEAKPYLMTPTLGPATRAQEFYNESHISTRNEIERCFGVLKRRFPVLITLSWRCTILSWYNLRITVVVFRH